MSQRPDLPDEEDDELDRLASAHLDGLTTAAEARRVASDPDLQERVAAMREVRAALRADLPPGSGDRREKAIAAALDAFDEAAGGGPDELVPRRARGGRTPIQPWRALGIAAAVLLLVVAVPVVAELVGDGGADTDELATEAADDSAARDDPAATAAPEGAGGAEESAGSAYSATAGDQADGAAPTDLGAFATLDALQERVRAVAEGQPEVAAEEPPVERGAADLDAAPCLEERHAAARAAGDTIVLAATAVLDGRGVGVVVVARADGARTMTVSDPAQSCEVLAVRALGPG